MSKVKERLSIKFVDIATRVKEVFKMWPSCHSPGDDSVDEDREEKEKAISNEGKYTNIFSLF